MREALGLRRNYAASPPHRGPPPRRGERDIRWRVAWEAKGAILETGSRRSPHASLMDDPSHREQCC